MLITAYDKLHISMQNDEVKKYIAVLSKRKTQILIKRILDIFICGLIFIITLPIFLIIAFCIKITSKGPVFFKQMRVGKDMKEFAILKFRTMVADADKKGVQLTTGDDKRITGFGKILRKTNLDEMPQLINVIKGDMSIVGTRPEVKRYVDCYTDEMYATLLLEPGMLSNASVKYKDENSLLSEAGNPVEVYINKILPDKMKYNLEYLSEVSILTDIKIIGRSIACMFKK